MQPIPRVCALSSPPSLPPFLPPCLSFPLALLVGVSPHLHHLPVPLLQAHHRLGQRQARHLPDPYDPPSFSGMTPWLLSRAVEGRRRRATHHETIHKAYGHGFDAGFSRLPSLACSRPETPDNSRFQPPRPSPLRGMREGGGFGGGDLQGICITMWIWMTVCVLGPDFP
jgi:hypothetical protein